MVIAVIIAAIAGSIVYILLGNKHELTERIYTQEILIQRIQAEKSALEGLSYQFIANEDLNKTLYTYSKKPNRYDVALANLSFTRHLESQRAVVSFLEEVFFLDYDEIDRIPLTMTEDFLRPEIAAVRHFVWARAIKSDGQYIWMDKVFTVHGESYLIAARLIKHLKTGEPIGVVVLLSNAQRLSELISIPSDRGKDSQPETRFLVSTSGQILSSTDQKLVGESIISKTGESINFEDIASQYRGPKSIVISYEGRRSTAIYSRLGSDGSYLLSVFPDLITLAFLRRFLISIIFSLGAALIFCLATRGGKSSNIQDNSIEKISDGIRTLPPDLPPLTNREKQLLILIAKGFSNKEIAIEFGIKEQTVKNYLRPLYDKLGVHDRVSALLKLRKYMST
ncbi:hypothetical protein MASR2M78_14170 [Treponema sp.]